MREIIAAVVLAVAAGQLLYTRGRVVEGRRWVKAVADAHREASR